MIHKNNVHFTEDDGVLIHVTVTGRCNARCAGCINSTITRNSDRRRDSIATFQEADPERDVAMISNLARRFPGRVITVCFYGGEPLLAPDKMHEIRLRLDRSGLRRRLRYMIYTNGELIERTVRDYPGLILNNWLLSVSIDGDRAQHNRVRPGTDLTRIIRSLKALREKHRYRGHVLMWTTLREDQSLAACRETFLDLRERGLVDHWFWHWVETREPFKDLDKYCRLYERDLEKIMKDYVTGLKNGFLMPVAHINELLIYRLTKKIRGHTCCGVELGRNFDLVDGTVRMCVDFPPQTGLGNIRDRRGVFKKRDLAALTTYKKNLACAACGVHFYCGGRCPVQAIYGGTIRTRQYCRLMRVHVRTVAAHASVVGEMLPKIGLTLQHVYDRSAFVTRFTDVIP